jgi:ADP-ribosylglycohydrolase
MDYDDGSTGISGFIVSSVVWSLYCFLRSPNNYLEALTITISAGGDTDSTAALTGCISGAFLGLKSLPEYLVSIVNDNDEWNAAQLNDLCTKTFQLCTASNTLPIQDHIP